MVRVLHFRSNYGVYVLDEQGERHHRPHAHIKHRKQRIASVFLETLTLFDVVERPPRDLIDGLAANQELLLERWEDLNGGE